MEYKIGDKKWMKYNLFVSLFNKVRNILINVNIFIVVYKDLLVDMRWDFFVFIFFGVVFYYV